MIDIDPSEVVRKDRLRPGRVLLVDTLKPLTTLVDGPQPQSSAVASVLALALLDRSSTISC